MTGTVRQGPDGPGQDGGPRRPGAREEVLARIAAAHAVAAPSAGGYDDVPRGYRQPETEQAAALGRAELLALLVERVEDYRATVHRCGADEVAATVATVLRGRGAARVVVPAGLPELDALVATDAVTEWVLERPEQPVGVPVLDGVDAVVTGAAVAVALTGTIVLDASPDQGRRAITLVPDHHVCVVRAEDVVHGVGEALARLDTTRPLTWISGPSATSDIELDRVEGVHGPRVLDVVVAGG